MPSLDAIGIVTGNLAESLRFYQLLGLEPQGETGGHVEAKLSGGLRLMWDTEELIRQLEPDWEPPAGGHRLSLAFLCEDVDATYAAVTAAGFEAAKEPWDAFWGQRYAQVRDPDGNTVSLFAPL